MSSLRKHDSFTHTDFARSERIFDESGLWYFRTREGGRVGPFRYQSEAQQMLERFVRDLQTKEAEAARQQKLHLRCNAIASITEQIISPAGISH